MTKNCKPLTMKISPDKLQHIKNEFLSFFSDDLTNQIETFDIKGVRLGFEQNKILSDAHPLSLKWKGFCSDIDKSEKAGKMIVSDETIHIINLYTALMTIKDIEYFQERIVSRLAKKNSYYSTCFEVMVARHYVDQGYLVEIVKETPNEARKSCDFLVSTKRGKVMVECKSLSNPDDKQVYIHREASRQIHKILKKNKKSYIVTIRASKILDLDDIDGVILSLNENLKTDNLNDVNNNIKDLSISYKKISEWGEIHDETDENYYEQSEFGHISWELVHENGLVVGHRNTTGFKLFPATKIDRLKTINNSLKTAKKQLTNEYPAIVHIEINGNEKYFHKTMDHCFDAIYRKMSGEFKSINAIVFEKTYYNSRPLSEYDILTEQKQVIATSKAIYPLPDDFSVYAAGSLDAGDIENAKTVSFQVKLEDFDHSLYRKIFWKTSPDGINQVSAYIIPGGTLRFEVIQKKHGRRLIEEKLSVIKQIFKKTQKEWNKLTYTWDKKNICLIINLNDENYDFIKTEKIKK